MEIKEIRSHEYSDEVYNAFTLEYDMYIPSSLDRILTDLVNNLKEYLLNQDSDILEKIKENLKAINDINVLDFKCKTHYIDFKANSETNLRLSILLPKIIRIRQIAYKKAYYIASDIILGKIPDYKLHEDFNLVREVILNNPLDNFYADLTIYLSDENLNRFYNECYLLDLISDILGGKNIPIETISELESKLDKSHNKMFSYLKRRFLPRTHTMKRDDNNVKC